MDSIWMIANLERELVHFIRDCFIANDRRVSTFVTSDEGVETQKRLWVELSDILGKIQPGIMANI